MNFHESLTPEQLGDFSTVESFLITGASGVIGSSFISLLKELRSFGLFKGRIVAVSKSQQVVGIESKHGDVSVVGDLTKPEVLADLPEVDFVLHAAAPSAPQEFMARPIETISLNVECTRLLKGLARRKFLFVSSSEIYSGLDFPGTELHVGTTNTVHPRAAYIESKRVGEVITLNELGLTLQPDGFVFRVALAYGLQGVKLEDSRLLYDLVRKALTSGRVALASGGSMVRSYCYAPDLATLMLLVALKGEKGIYNMGHDDPREIRDIARLVASIAGASFHEEFSSRELVSGAPMVVRMDLSKLHSLFPEFDYTSFENGVGKLVAHFRGLVESGKQGER